MRSPLYQFPEGVEPAPGDDGHRGLWYDKFYDKWDDRAWTMRASGEADSGDSPKLAWVKAGMGTVGSPARLCEYAKRLYDLAKTRGGDAVVVTARYRFVTGLGRNHPVENGFSWHPTLGTPYLAGSSLKGLISAWATAAEGTDTKQVKRLLGEPDRAGTVGLLDAVPLRPATLEADVLTPHYANWTPDEPPGDWRSPTPVPFLVAAAGLSMLCGIVPLRTCQSDDVAAVRRWLTAALDQWGAGAKTAVGYGHFQADLQDRTLAEWDRDRRRSETTATPEGRWRYEFEGSTEEGLLQAVRRHLMTEPLPEPEERRAFVRVVLETGMVKSWKAGRQVQPGTSTGRKKLQEAARAVLDCATEFGLVPPP